MNPNLKEISQPRKTGSLLSRLIIQALEMFKALTTDQIWVMFYRKKKTGRRMAQDKLYCLLNQKQVKRIRFGFDQPFIYYIDKPIGQWRHVVAVNWIYIWFKLRLSSWEALTYWKTEVNYKFIRPDAVVGIKNNTADEMTYWFVELDRAESRNHWDKIEKYNQLYETRGMPEGFPIVLCVTTDTARIELLRKKAADQNLNRNNLKFEFRLLDEIIAEVRP